MAIQRIAHVGLCVSDLERARRFYRDALGFTEVAHLESSGESTSRLLQLPDADLQASIFERDGLRIELIHFVSPGAAVGDVPRPMNRPGLTHLAIRVDSLDAALAELARAGGTPLEETRMENPAFHARAAIVLDPDGTRLELIEAPGDPARPMGEPVA